MAAGGACSSRGAHRFHGFPEIVDRGGRVERRRRLDVAVAEQLLHNAQVLGPPQRAHAGGVPEVMDPGLDAGLGPFALVGAETVIGDRVALALDELPAGLRAFPGALRLEREHILRVLAAPSPQDAVDPARHRDDARHAPLGHDADDAELEIDLRPGQDHIAAAEPRDDRQPSELGEAQQGREVGSSPQRSYSL